MKSDRVSGSELESAPRGSSDGSSESEPLWFKDAVIYQTHVRAFFDSLNDGVGDFPGLTKKLDYLQDLGITTIWLLPFYPSPLKDDGYDIANYTDVNPTYGTLSDFKRFLKEAHARGLKVITELVLNHTSDEHPWFQRARRAAPGTSERDFYVWSDTPTKYSDARIIFKDFETSNWSWDPVAKAYYWHRFYAHQPDLNFENPAVHQALFAAVDFWLKIGVDGLRLDAVPYLYERESTNCENLPETHQFLKSLRSHIDEHFANRMLLAEANQWPEDAIAYFGDGDECHAAFHFPVMPRLFMAIHQEDRFPIVDILQQTPAIPDNCQWFVFLRNHDELTLEMVTDEERDYMYRVYAHDRQARINLGIRRRLAPLLGNNRRKIELMNGLLFSLPGTPVIYYGDEIGMGDNIYLGDRDGVRTPMQWNADRNAGFSRANPQKLYLPVIIDSEYLFETVNVETQRNNPQSLWWWMKRLIALRQRHVAFGRGTLEMLSPENGKVLAFLRSFDGQHVLVVANLSRFSQFVELDLSAFEGSKPRELFGQTAFPAIGRQPYLLTLGPHAFYWLSLERESHVAAERWELPKLSVQSELREIVSGRTRAMFENAVRSWMVNRRWFAGKARTIQSVSVSEAISMPPVGTSPGALLALVRVEYTEGEPDSYLLPLALAAEDDSTQLVAEVSGSLIARVAFKSDKSTSVLLDASTQSSFAATLLDFIASGEEASNELGSLVAWGSPVLTELLSNAGTLAPFPSKTEQSNTSVIYGDKAILKLFRKVDLGTNPDLEISHYLTEKVPFANTPPLLGTLEYKPHDGEPIGLGILQALVPGAVTAWEHTLDQLGRYFENVLALRPSLRPSDEHWRGSTLLQLADGDAPAAARDLMGGDLESAALLGRRTAEMHVALAAMPELPDFAPEPFSQLYQRSLYQSMRKLTLQKFQLLRKRLKDLPPTVVPAATAVFEGEKILLDRFRALTARKLEASRMRIHGDYHLGQVLYTGKDFMIIDFEGEPARPLSQRRLKRSPLQDLAGMLRSYHYAASQGYFQLRHAGLLTTESEPSIKRAASFWYLWTSSAFLKAYLGIAQPAGLLPANRDDAETLLSVYLLEKAVYELGYELNNRPDWVEVPLKGIHDLISPGV